MRIFHKLLILLLVIGLLPLLSLSLHDQRLTEDLGIELAAQARDSATRRMSDELHRIVALSASVLHRTRLLVDLALRVQGREAELRLAAPAQAPEERMPVWFAEQYDAGMAPPDTEASKAHLRYLPGAPDAAALAVSFDHQVFLTAPGVDREAVRDDIARLVPMTSIYRSLRETLPGLFLFQYTALASGLHSSYPGHGGYPQGYDPRRRAWYSLATAVGEPIWTPPLIDASTRQLLFTAAAPVREPSGAIAGVTAVDVPILSLLQRIRDEAQLPGNVESLLVQVQRNDRRGPALRVIAHREYQASGRPWDALLEPAWLLPEAGESH
ncbi:MAG: PDC sensor domain-containing protein, partial [Acetobacterales bacterium]